MPNIEQDVNYRLIIAALVDVCIRTNIRRALKP